MSLIELPEFEEEKRVVLAAQQGDRLSAGQLYQWFGDRLYRQVILPRLPVVEQAEDVLRDSFRIIFERISQFTPKDRSIFFWMRRIAINLVIDVYRRETKKRKIAENLLANDAVYETVSQRPMPADKKIELSDTRKMIEKSLTKINSRYAQALRLRLLEDLSREECAAVLDVTVNNFDVLFHRACKAFRNNYPP